MLLYLVLRNGRGFTSRQELMAMFWPEADGSRARNSLRQALSFLRKALGRKVIVNRGASAVAVAPNAIACDAVQFEELLDEGRPKEALALYRGVLGQGLHVVGAHAFEDWLSSERERLRRRAAKAAWDVSAGYETTGAAEEAAFWGKRALAMSPFSEPEVQRLLHLLDRLGDWTGALRAYQGLEAYLSSEFDARPSAKTLRIIEKLRRKVEVGDLDPSDHFGTRRLSRDRRGGQRRQSTSEYHGPERRVNPDRRKGERRSGRDRRSGF